MTLLTTFHVKKTYDVLETSIPAEKKQAKRDSLCLTAITMLSIVKFIMNPYPTLDDLSFCLLLTVLDAKFILREV
jgi:hypothetical protein